MWKQNIQIERPDFQIQVWYLVKFQLDKWHIWKTGFLLRCLWQGFRGLISGTSLEISMFYRRTVSLTHFFLPLPGCCAPQPPGNLPRHEAALRVRVTREGGGWVECGGKGLVSNKSAKPWKEGLRRNRWGASNIASEVYLLNEQKPRLSDLGQILLQFECIYFIRGL